MTRTIEKTVLVELPDVQLSDVLDFIGQADPHQLGHITMTTARRNCEMLAPAEAGVQFMRMPQTVTIGKGAKSIYIPADTMRHLALESGSGARMMVTGTGKWSFEVFPKGKEGVCMVSLAERSQAGLFSLDRASLTQLCTQFPKLLKMGLLVPIEFDPYAVSDPSFSVKLRLDQAKPSGE